MLFNNEHHVVGHLLCTLCDNPLSISAVVHVHAANLYLQTRDGPPCLRKAASVLGIGKIKCTL